MKKQTLTATTLRNIIGELELDETLTSRDLINNKMCLILDEATSAMDRNTENFTMNLFEIGNNVLF